MSSRPFNNDGCWQTEPGRSHGISHGSGVCACLRGRERTSSHGAGGRSPRPWLHPLWFFDALAWPRRRRRASGATEGEDGGGGLVKGLNSVSKGGVTATELRREVALEHESRAQENLTTIPHASCVQPSTCP